MKHILFTIALGLMISCSAQNDSYVFRNDIRPEYSKTVSVAELKDLGISNFNLIDVRLVEDFAKNPNLIDGATHLSPDIISEWAKSIPKDKPVVVYCVKGKWVSQKAATYLNDQGYDVYSLEGGINAWNTSTGEVSTTLPDFKQSVLRHLQSVENRNYPAFKETLTHSTGLNVIFPGGSILEDTQAVLDFHKTWFQDETWIFKTNLVKVIEGSDQSTALVKYKFQDNAKDEPREAWLILTFQVENNEWRLIHDQNTRIDGKN